MTRLKTLTIALISIPLLGLELIWTRIFSAEYFGDAHARGPCVSGGVRPYVAQKGLVRQAPAGRENTLDRFEISRILTTL
jgi:hypothetical protein